MIHDPESSVNLSDFPAGIWIAERDGLPAELQQPQGETETPKNTYWQIAQRHWETEHVLRAYFAEELHHPFNRHCGNNFELNERDEPGGGVVKRYKHYGCNERGACPFCAVAYGVGKGRDQFSLMKACLDMRLTPPGKGDVLTWSLIATLPKQVSEALGATIDADDKVPPQVAKVRSRFKTLLAKHIFRVREADLMDTVNTHLVSSSKPLEGYHIHFHNMIPNVTPDGRTLSNHREFPLERFVALKRDWYKTLQRMFPDAMEAWRDTQPRDGTPIYQKLNFEAHFVPNDPAGWRKLKHHCLYDARHMMQDLRDYVERCDYTGAPVFHRKEEIERFLSRCEIWQRTKTTTYYGALTPGRRKDMGLFAQEPPVDEAPWEEPLNSYRRLERFTPSGAVFRVHVGDGRFEEEAAQSGQISLRDMSNCKPVECIYSREGMFVEPALRKLRFKVGQMRRTKAGREALDALDATAPGASEQLKDFVAKRSAVSFLLRPELAGAVDRCLDVRVGDHLEPLLKDVDFGFMYHDSSNPVERVNLNDPTASDLTPGDIPCLVDHAWRMQGAL